MHQSSDFLTGVKRFYDIQNRNVSLGHPQNLQVISFSCQVNHSPYFDAQIVTSM